MTQILPRFYRRQQQADDHAKVAKIVAESGADIVPVNPGAGLHADPIRLRGIPVVGGSAGVSPGTDPAREVERRMMQSDRSSS